MWIMEISINKPSCASCGGGFETLILCFCLYISSFRYESLIGSIKKKFAKKRDRAATEDGDVNQNVVETSRKRVFLKPQV